MAPYVGAVKEDGSSDTIGPPDPAHRTELRLTVLSTEPIPDDVALTGLVRRALEGEYAWTIERTASQ